MRLIDVVDQHSDVVPMKVVRAHPGLPWSRVQLSQNPGITLEDVDRLELPDATGIWRWEYLSTHVPIDDVRAHPNRPWDVRWLFQNPGLTLKDVEHLELPNLIV